MSYTTVAHLTSCVPSTALCKLDSGTCTNCMDCFNVHLHHLFKNTHTSTCTHTHTRTHAKCTSSVLLVHVHIHTCWVHLEGRDVSTYTYVHPFAISPPYPALPHPTPPYPALRCPTPPYPTLPHSTLPHHTSLHSTPPHPTPPHSPLYCIKPYINIFA